MPTETIRLGEIEVRFVLESKDTDGQLATFEFTVPPGVKVPAAHSHIHYDETIYGLEGLMTFAVNGHPVDIGPGDAYFIPRGVMHGFHNRRAVTAKALAVATPGLIHPDYFRDLAALLNAGDPPDMGKIRAVMNRHGLVPAALQQWSASS